MEFVGWASFAAESIDPAAAARLLAGQDFGFQPAVIRSRLFRGRKFSPTALGSLAKTEELARTTVKSVTVGLGDFVAIADDFVNWSSSIWPANFRFFEDASSVSGFVMAGVGDADDFFWQTTTSINAYEGFNRPHDSLPKVLRNGEWEIDVSRNPGRQSGHAESGLIFWAASTLWFGLPALRYFDLERLLQIPDTTVQHLPNDVVRIDLYSPNEPIESIRFKQQRFRDHMELDTLEARLNAMPESAFQTRPLDPYVEIEHGTFPNGGNRLYFGYLDDNKRPAPKSKAHHVIVFEYHQTQQTKRWRRILTPTEAEHLRTTTPTTNQPD